MFADLNSQFPFGPSPAAPHARHPARPDRLGSAMRVLAPFFPQINGGWGHSGADWQSLHRRGCCRMQGKASNDLGNLAINRKGLAMLPVLVFVAGLTLGQSEGAAKQPPAGKKTESALAAKADEVLEKKEPEKKEAEKAVADALASKVKMLIQRLDSDEQAQRESAEKDLIALGQDILPHLPTVGTRTPAEIKNRLGRVRAALEQAAVEATAKTTFVTLSGEMRISEALAAIEKQTGNKLAAAMGGEDGPRDPKVKLELAKVPFWEALDTVLDAGELKANGSSDETKGLSFMPRAEGETARLGHATYSGPFRLAPTRVDSTADLLNPNLTSLKVTVAVAWEPRIRPVVLAQPLTEVKGLDENGKEIAVDGSQGALEAPVEGNNAGVELEFPLKLPGRDVKKIASLKGNLSVVLLGREEEFVFADVSKAKGAEVQRGGVTVFLDRCRDNGESLFDVAVRVRFDKAGNALESHRGWIYDNPCYLIDKQGKQRDADGSEASLLDDNEVGISFKFALEDGESIAGYKLVYKTPAAIIKVPVEFELKNIPLP